MYNDTSLEYSIATLYNKARPALFHGIILWPFHFSTVYKNSNNDDFYKIIALSHCYPISFLWVYSHSLRWLLASYKICLSMASFEFWSYFALLNEINSCTYVPFKSFFSESNWQLIDTYLLDLLWAGEALWRRGYLSILVQIMATSLYLDYRIKWLNINWTLKNKLQWALNQNTQDNFYLRT